MLKIKTLSYSKKFKKDIKKQYIELVSTEFLTALSHLMRGEALPAKFKDHALSGELKGLRDCHIKPDLVLIYRSVDDILELHRLGSHSEIFG